MLTLLAFSACAVWNSIKPLPSGTHVTSLPARLAESQIDFIDELSRPGALLRRQLDFVARAEQTLVLDQCPLAPALSDALLLRKRQRPNIKILIVTDPRPELYGGTAARTLSTLERAGVVVARTRLERMRDSDPLYSSWWRLAVGWWSDAFDEPAGEDSLTGRLRRHNFKANERRLIVADDGAGGWTSLVMSAAAGIDIRGHLARDIVASELRIATWSTDDDRLPAAPPVDDRGVGAIDARFVTEGAIQGVLRDAIGVAGNGDSIKIAVQAFDERQIVSAVARAAERGAHVQLLLDPELAPNQAAAGELRAAAAGNVDVRWRGHDAHGAAGYAVIQHRGDVWIVMGSASFTRRGLDDLNLDADIELHMPVRAGPARGALELFDRQWSGGAVYAAHADESPGTYWRYRLADATGSGMF